MASELKVNKITPESGVTLTLGDSGDTINFGSGVLPNFENLTVTGDLTVDTNSLKVDSTNNFVGIGTASPTVALDVVGGITATNTTGAQILAKYSADQHLSITQSGAASLIKSRHNTSDGEFYFMGGVTGRTRLKINTSGNVEFYEDTGTSAKLTWNPTNEVLDFNDNVKAQFGDSNDLQIYHDGSNSYIKDVGTGNLTVQGDQYVILRGATGEYLSGSDGAAVSIKYNGAEKLATTSSGIDVTGTVTSDGLTVDGVANINTGDLYINGATPSLNITDTDTNCVFILNGSSTSGIIQYQADTTSVGSNPEHWFKSQGRFVAKIHDNGDFSLYEDTGTTPKLFWDASAESLGIGTSFPVGNLVVSSSGVGSANSNYRQIVAENNGNSGITILSGTTSQGGLIFGDANQNNVGSVRYNHSADEMVFDVNSSRALTVNSSGNFGIGTSSPSGKLHIQGISGSVSGLVLQTPESSGDTNSIDFLNLNGDFRMGIEYDASTADLNIVKRDRTKIVTFDESTGNVGIDQTSPTGELHVGSSSSSGDTDLYVQSVQTSRPRLRLWSGTVAKLEFSVGSTADIGTTTNHPLKFNTNNSERMRIEEGGDVGIGTTNPTSKLEVNGTVTATAFSGDGSALTGISGGKIGQVVQGTDTTETSITSTSYTDTGLSASITPTSTSSKILVMWDIQYRVNTGSSNNIIALIKTLRGATLIGSYAKARSDGFVGENGGTLSFSYLDSPSTTSSTTYKTQAALGTSGDGRTFYAETGQDSVTALSSITLMEILV